MDGLPRDVTLHRMRRSQRTLRAGIGCVGVGLHSGIKVRLGLAPAVPGSGIVFRRTDLADQADIPARFDHVVESRLCTIIARPDRPEARVATIEHVVAALAGAGVDNALVTVDGPEVPILDGSSASFLFLIECAGVLEQAAPCAEIEVMRPVRVENGASFAELRPAPAGLELTQSIAFDAEAIGSQALSLAFSPAVFRTELARARTFTMADEIEQLHAAGLARGGSLDNAIVVDGARVLNPGGLRMPDEFVRHKMLDAIGDLALAGAPLRGRFSGHCSGHALNNRLLRALFSDTGNWRGSAAADALAMAEPAWHEETRKAA